MQNTGFSVCVSVYAAINKLLLLEGAAYLLISHINACK